MVTRSNLLRFDGSAGAVVGILMFALLGWLTELYALPRDFLILMGTANLAYGAYSLTLSTFAKRPKVLIHLLIVANGVWGLLCFRWAFVHWQTASFFGLAQLILEGLFVGGLACLEWHWREYLYSDPERAQ